MCINKDPILAQRKARLAYAKKQLAEWAKQNGKNTVMQATEDPVKWLYSTLGIAAEVTMATILMEVG